MGIWKALRMDRPPLGVRILLVGEVLFFVGVMTAYLYLLLPANQGPKPIVLPPAQVATRPVTDGSDGNPPIMTPAEWKEHKHRDTNIRWFDPIFYVFALAFPIGMNLLHGDRPKDSGLRLDNLAPAARDTLLVTLLLAGGLVLAGLCLDSLHWRSWRNFWSRLGRYLLWGPLQQYMLQAFALRRLRQAQLPTPLAVVVAATAFGLLHAPNWLLVGLTTGAGLAWCTLFLRRPNLIPLGLAHAALAMMVYYTLPEQWHRNLAVGGMYLRELARAAGQ